MCTNMITNFTNAGNFIYFIGYFSHCSSQYIEYEKYEYIYIYKY